MKYLMLFLFIGCSCGKNIHGLDVKNNPSIQKQGILLNDRMESTPFVWNNEILLMVPAREIHKIEIYNGTTLISSTDSDLGLASAIVANSTLYVFGSVGWKDSTENQIAMISTSDLIHWSEPIIVLASVTNRVYFNSSVTQIPNGSFVMAAETCEPNTVCFSSRFFISHDLINWVETGSIFKPDIYAACPTIRYVDGIYYVFYLKIVADHFSTYISRSVDLVTWQDSPIPVIVAYGDEGVNNSDLDLVELNGDVFISYADGNQKTWTNLRTATYNGTLRELLMSFFPN